LSLFYSLVKHAQNAGASGGSLVGPGTMPVTVADVAVHLAPGEEEENKIYLPFVQK
jgi:hypothetical protein